MYGVALRRLDSPRNMARFYAVTVKTSLSGQWALVKRWGRINTEGRRVEEWFSQFPPALAAAADQVEAKRRRGYQPADLRSGAVLTARDQVGHQTAEQENSEE